MQRSSPSIHVQLSRHVLHVVIGNILCIHVTVTICAKCTYNYGKNEKMSSSRRSIYTQNVQLVHFCLSIIGAHCPYLEYEVPLYTVHVTTSDMKARVKKCVMCIKLSFRSAKNSPHKSLWSITLTPWKTSFGQPFSPSGNRESHQASHQLRCQQMFLRRGWGWLYRELHRLCFQQ